MGAVGTKIVKSAGRVVELLEFFDRDRAEITVMDVVRTLDYPQSSASELLHCLVSLGYLTYDRYRRTYQLTARVALLGAWAHPDLFRSGQLLSVIDHLVAETGETAVIGAIDGGVWLRYIHVASHSACSVSGINRGMTRSPIHSALGRVMLSHWSENKIQHIVHRLNAEEQCAERRIRVPDLLEALRGVADAGYAVVSDEDGGEHPMVAVNIPVENGVQQLALGLTFSPALMPDVANLAKTLQNALNLSSSISVSLGTLVPSVWKSELHAERRM